MCHHPSRRSEDCIDFNMHEEKEEPEKTTGIEEKKLLEGLEEAAEKHISNVFDAVGHPGWDWEMQDVLDAFKAGAEYGMNQMFTIKYDNEPLDSAARKTFEKWIPMEILEYNGLQMPLYNQGALIMMFDAGAKWDRAKMMENAVEGVVQDDGQFINFGDGRYIDLDPTMGLKPVFELTDGDKVKVIVISEEK